MITTIKAELSAGYDEKYEIDIRTSKMLTSKEYQAITDAIDVIRKTLQDHIQAKMPKAVK